jgi:hypothetical protein
MPTQPFRSPFFFIYLHVALQVLSSIERRRDPRENENTVCYIVLR